MPIGIYQLQCHTCHVLYIGQTDQRLEQSYKEHARYINSNNPHSAFALQILHNKHDYRPMNFTMSLLHPVHRNRRMNSLENFYIQLSRRHNTIIKE
jgi:GIY-YIG catalytic domain.